MYRVYQKSVRQTETWRELQEISEAANLEHSSHGIDVLVKPTGKYLLKIHVSRGG
jgi:hypothetical protein